MTAGVAHDWTAIESAMERCKRGTPQPGDMIACSRAYEAAPDEYARRKDAVDARVLREERERFTIPGKPRQR